MTFDNGNIVSQVKGIKFEKKKQQVIVVLSDLEMLTENHNSNIVQTECLLWECFYKYLSQRMKGTRDDSSLSFLLSLSCLQEGCG